jgi:membrane protein YdbS with pleckstrin-like domain
MPPVRQPPEKHLSANALTVARANGIIAALFLTPLIAAPILLLGKFGASSIGLAAVVGAVFAGFRVLFVPALRIKWFRYELTEHELYLQHGVFTRHREVVPYTRIQNVDTVQGPLDRYFKLSGVTVSTAGGSTTIPWLDEEVATQLRQHLGARAASVRQVSDA